ncbi:MAG: hypothetical protein WC223_10295 [Bacteroidales bacterium]|jgi:hypothetical protein
MKKVLKSQSVNLFMAFVCLLVFSMSCFSQSVGISTNGAIPPNVSAGLDVNFSSEGLLIPRIALTGTSSFAPLSSHVAGMTVYNTATTGDVIPGIYYNNGTKWIAGFPKANTIGDMQYWDGSSWRLVTIGQPGQLLQINGSGIPSWGGAGFANLITTFVTDITTITATSGGTVASDGGNAVTAYGVCWATTTNPTIANSKTVDGSGVGSFISNITGLTSGTTYYVRAYATNGAGTSYGNQVSFTTP